MSEGSEGCSGFTLHREASMVLFPVVASCFSDYICKNNALYNWNNKWHF